MINILLIKISNEKKEKELDKIFKKYGFGKNDDKLNSEIIKFIEKYPDGSDILDRYLDKLDVAMDEVINELDAVQDELFAITDEACDILDNALDQFEDCNIQ